MSSVPDPVWQAVAATWGFSFAEPYSLGLVFLGLAVFAAIGALSHQDERAFSASLVYLGLGLAAAVVLGLTDVEWVDPLEDAELVQRVTEFALITALFATGLRLDRALRLPAWGSVARLLTLVMALTITAVAVFGWAVMGLSVAAAVVLGAALAPTDPVLAGDIGVGPPDEEDEREPNFSITAEAGLNDGLALPFLLFGLALAERDSGWFFEWLAADVVYALGIGAAVGAVAGYGLAAIAVFLRTRKLLAHELDGWLGIGAVLLIYGITESAAGSGYIAAFVGGLAFRRYERDHELNGRVHEGAEQVEKFMELAAILMLGSLLTIAGLGAPGWEGWLLVAALLLVIRPASALLALIGSNVESRGGRAFVAWFGVRGVGTLYYVATIVTAGALSDGEQRVVVWTAIACVIISIVVHGITGGPALRLLFAGLREEERDAVDPPLRPRPAPEPATPPAR